MARMVAAKASTKAGSEGPASTTAKSKVVRMRGTAEADAPKPKKTKASGVRVHVGKTTGMSIAEYQNKLMKDNFKAKLTDEKLALAMRREFPSAITYTVGHVRGIRSAWNKGKHGNEVPPKPLPEFDAEGNPIKGRTRAARLTQKDTPPVARKGKAAKASKAPVVDEDEEEIEDEDVIEDEEEETEEEDE